LRSSVASFARRLIEIPRVRVLNQQRLQQLSPAGERYDPRSDLQNGFPYQQSHADVLASLLAALMVETPLCKGIITDLDDTLWRGILGELGPQGVTWDMAEHAQIHGVYQQFLDAMAERGALIGVASKNDAGLVEDALNRPDLHIRRERLFPVEAGWGRKSESVSRILHTWNVGADAVIFVDDNPAEVAEVEFRHPQIKGRHFRGEDPQAVLALLSELRDCFGKRVVTAEDGIRSASLRSNQALQERASDTGSWEAFLQQMDARIQISFQDGPSDTRAFELINKTNQFNLNGRRFTPGEWQARLAGNNAVLATVSYHDKFGPLGKIAVLLGAADPARAVVRIETWVMSCRAFSRRIEYQCLRQLFERFQAKEIVLDFMPTPRNAPARDFIAKFGEPCAEFRITREQFERNCPPLYHSCQEVAAIG
jgi:FkbH-like protein